MGKKESLYVDPAWIRKGGIAYIPIPNQSEYAGCQAMIDVRDAEADCNSLDCLMVSENDNEVVLIKTEDHNGFFIHFNRFIYAMKKENIFDGNKNNDDQR